MMVDLAGDPGSGIASCDVTIKETCFLFQTYVDSQLSLKATFSRMMYQETAATELPGYNAVQLSLL